MYNVHKYAGTALLLQFDEKFVHEMTTAHSTFRASASPLGWLDSVLSDHQ